MQIDDNTIRINRTVGMIFHIRREQSLVDDCPHSSSLAPFPSKSIWRMSSYLANTKIMKNSIDFACLIRFEWFCFFLILFSISTCFGEQIFIAENIRISQQHSTVVRQHYFFQFFFIIFREKNKREKLLLILLPNDDWARVPDRHQMLR